MQGHAIVIRSPHSGKADQLSQALSYLASTIEIARIISIADLDGLLDQGPRWKEEGLDLVIAAGGDGLVGGVITHIAESGLPLGIIPLGTSNDIARSVGIPQELRRAAETVAQGKIIAIDIGAAQPAEQMPHLASPSQEKPALVQVAPRQHGKFAHVLTAGLNVQFARLATDVVIRQRYGSLTYPFAALEVLRNHKVLEMEISFEGLAQRKQKDQAGPMLYTENATLHCRTLQATVINAPVFGGRWQLTVPEASLYDRLLDIVVIEDMGLEALQTSLDRLFSRQRGEPPDLSIWHARYPQLQLAELSGIPGLHHVQARGVTITTNLDPQDVTLDGEVRGQTPLHTQLADEQLRVIVPL